jgi:hypothetical protein
MTVCPSVQAGEYRCHVADAWLEVVAVAVAPRGGHSLYKIVRFRLTRSGNLGISLFHTSIVFSYALILVAFLATFDAKLAGRWVLCTTMNAKTAGNLAGLPGQGCSTPQE